MQNTIERGNNKLFGLLDRALSIADSKWLVWLLLGFGAALRVREYILNNALNEDEAALSLNIINKSMAELFGRLESNQVAPVGFLLLEKFAVTLFGTTEYSLRLVPLLLSLASLVLFWQVARRYVSGAASLFALGLFTSSAYLINYGAQVKQYSGDVAIALAVTLAGLYLIEQPLTIKQIVWFALLGAAVVWFSHPSVFVLAGVGSTLGIAAIWRRDWRRLTRLAVACGIWTISFLASFLVSLRGVSLNTGLERSWDAKKTFMPLPPISIADLKWFPETLLRFFTNPLTSPFPAIAIAVLIIGFFAAYRTNRQRLLLLGLPVLFALAASGLHKYPFGKRLILFLVPAVILLIAAGIQIFQTGAALLRMTGVVLALLLVLKPMVGAASHARWGPSGRDIRNIMSYVKEHRQPGDLTYFYHGQRDAFRYYAPRVGFEEEQYIIGNDPLEKVPKRAAILLIFETDKADLDQLRGKGRVWIVFSNARTYRGVNEEEYMCEHLDGFGRRLEQHKRPGIAAYLYDTSEDKLKSTEIGGSR
jgi:hypothetical protein